MKTNKVRSLLREMAELIIFIHFSENDMQEGRIKKRLNKNRKELRNMGFGKGEVDKALEIIIGIHE